LIPIGTIISSKYRLLRLLGDGGMGAVYEAEHLRLGTHVAVKILHSDISRRPGIVERFLQEARVSAQIKSPHVVQVTDVDQTPEGLAYLVMELLEGEPLSRVLERDRKLPVATAVDYTTQILEALEAAHALGVVHRDLKPENVFVTTLAGKRVLKLIDFGIAKVRRDFGGSDPGAKNLTMAGVSMGTAEYMAPEQAFSADKADVRSDVYAVGVMLYEMISGTRPVLGDDARTIALKVERGEITPLVHVAPDVPREIAGLCHRAMAPRPELRFQSGAEMRLALEGAMKKRSVVGEPLAPPVVAPSLEEIPAGVTTQRGGAPLVFSPPAGATPVAEPMPMAALPPPAPTTYPVRRKGGGGMTALLIIIPVLLGIGIVVALAVSKQSDSQPAGPVATPTGIATPTAADAGAPTTTATAIDPLKPLSTTQPYVPPGTGTKPSPSATASDGGVAQGPDAAVNPFQFNLPSFDGGLPVITLPSGFQIPTSFPGLPPPPPSN
jgi:hypothetical protein